MTRVRILHGDVLEQDTDVLVSTANVKLDMSGGVNGAIRERGGEAVQAELRAFLAARATHFVEPGTVVRTGPGALAFRAILHAVAIDGFYGSSPELVARTIRAAVAEAAALGARSLALPALATGYGPLDARTFAEALADALAEPCDLDEVRVVLWREAEAEAVRGVLAERLAGGAVELV